MKRLLLLVATGLLLLGALVAWANTSPQPIPNGTHVDRILVVKSEHRLYLLQSGRTVASFPVSLGRGGKGAKRREGDGLTPEGLYSIDFHNSASAFYRSVHISYPSPEDSARARAAGHAPGGAVMIHGLPPRFAAVGKLQRSVDWTNGCIAVTNPEMKQIFELVADGTKIEIRP